MRAVRGALVLIAVGALAVGLGLALFAPRPAQAQTSSTLISNTGQTDGTQLSFSEKMAQPFTTGSNAGGYKLTSVEIEGGFGDTSGTTDPTFTVAIHTGSGTLVGTSVGSLTSSGFTAGTNSFTSSSGIDLDANTNYFVVLDWTGSGDKSPWIRSTASNAEDSGGAAGWSIGNRFLRRLTSSAAWSFPSGTTNAVEVSIKGVPALELDVSVSSVLESAGSTDVTVTATVAAAPTSNLTVALAVDSTSTATDGTDYAPLGTLDSITIAGGSTSGTATVSINPTEDAIDEGAGETIVITGSATGVPPGKATVTITDNDTASPITLSASPTSIDEDDSATAVTVTATLPSGVTRSTDTTVSLNSTLGGNATGADYTATGLPPNVTITAGSFSGSATGLMIDPEDDAIDEGTGETIVINGSLDGFTVNPATITLADDDDPEITLSSTRVGSGNDGSVDEGESATFTIAAMRNTADKSTTVSVPLAVVTSGDGASTATGGTDFTALSSTTIQIPAGMASGTRNVTISTIEDRLDEGTGETIVLGATVSRFTVNPVTITIVDDDDPSTDIILTVTDNSIGEGETSNTTVTVKAEVDDAAPTSAVTVALSLAGTAVSGTDYVANPGTANPGTLESITIAAGQVEGTSTFVIDPTDDRIDEDDETITVNGSATGGLTATDSVDITLTDNDTAVLAMSTGTTTSIGEGDAPTSVTVTATLDIERSKNTTVALALSGNAVKGTDYTVPSTLPSITIAAGSTTNNASLNITPTDDRLDEGTGETITIAGSADGVTGDSTSITLTDNDSTSTAVTVTLVNPDDDTDLTSIGESAEATSVKVVATLNDAAVKTATNMTLTFAGTATATTDYSITPDTPPPKVTFNPDEHEASVRISVHPTHDLIDENDETIVVGVSAASPITTVTADTITLTDDDTASSVTITVIPATVREADGGRPQDLVDTGVAQSMMVTATIDDGITRLVDTAVTLSLSGAATKGTAYGNGIDYKTSAAAPGSITITKGESSGTASFTITPQQDSLVEGSETITVGGSSDLAVNSADVTLSDDDSASTSLKLSTTRAVKPVPKTLQETAGSTQVAVIATLDGGTLTADVVVTLMLEGEAEGDGVDYSLTESLPQITILEGKTQGSANIYIDPIDDRIDEGSFETITISGTTSGLDVRPETLRIADNDNASKRITLSVNPGSVDEDARGASSVTVTATLAGSVTRSVPTEVDLTLGGKATLNTDYTAMPDDPTVIIPAEATTGTAIITIDPIDDSNFEGTEAIVVRGAVPNFRVEDATVRLVDDELTPPNRITNLSASLRGDTSNAVDLSWTPPDPGPITSYRLQRRAGSGSWIDAGHPWRGASDHSVSGLAYNTYYEWRLYARNSEGEGPASNVVTVTTGSRPTPPRNTPPGGGGGSPGGGGGSGPVGGGGGGDSPAGPPPGLSVPEPLSRTPSFTDVPDGSVLGPGIQRAARLGIMPGVGDGRFDPERPVTRLDTAAPMVRLWQALGGTCPRATRTPFRDLPARGGVRVDIACLYAEGVVAGTGAVTYSPDRVLNRAQMMTLMARMWRLRGHDCPDDPPDPFDDVSDGHYHRADILCMYALGVTRGTGANTFSPEQQLTRAEVAVFAARFHDAVPDG